MTPFSAYSYLNSSSPVLNNDEHDSAIFPTIEESSFCSNFVCCGQSLKDFHALLQHYEETHVKIEEVEDENITSHAMGLDLDALIAADSLLNVGACDIKSSRQSTAPTPVHFHVPTPVSAASRVSTPFTKRPEPSGTASSSKKKAKILTLGIEPCDFVGNDLSAFDNTVIRPMDATRFDPSLLAFNGQHGYSRIAPKRSHSVPAIPNLPLGEHNFKFIQSILSSTVDPPSIEGSPSSFHTVSSKPSVHYSHHMSSTSGMPSYYHSVRGNSDRPFVCPVSGCGKTYKNANGLKYHAIHGHDGVLVEKPHKCPFSGCGKRYKNSNGLKYHFQHAHPNAMPPSSTMSTNIPPRPSSIPPPRVVPVLKQADNSLLNSSQVSIADLIKSNPMVKQHLPAILRNLQQMAMQRANSDRKPPSN